MRPAGNARGVPDGLARLRGGIVRGGAAGPGDALRAGADRGAAVSPAALAALRAMQGAALPAALPERVFREVRALAGGLLEHHADLDPRARAVAFQVLAAG